MRIVRFFFRAFTVLFNLILGLYLFGVGSVALLSGETFRFDVVPGLEDRTLAGALVAFGLAGVLLTLAALRSIRATAWLTFLWNFLVVSILVCAFTRPSYRFAGMDHFMDGVYLFVLCLVALWGGWLQVRAARERRRTASLPAT
jgi:hypothetical protein